MHFLRSLTAKTGAPEPRSRGPIHGDATAEARMRHAEWYRRAWPAPGSHLRPRAQALLCPPRAAREGKEKPHRQVRGGRQV